MSVKDPSLWEQLRQDAADDDDDLPLMRSRDGEPVAKKPRLSIGHSGTPAGDVASSDSTAYGPGGSGGEESSTSNALSGPRAASVVASVLPPASSDAAPASAAAAAAAPTATTSLATAAAPTSRTAIYDDDDDAPLLSNDIRMHNAPKVPNSRPDRGVKKEAEPSTPLKVSVVLKKPRGAAGAPKLQKASEEHFEPINCWWEDEGSTKRTTQWSYLEHHGLMFTKAYEPHGVPVLINGKEVQLPPPLEEVANYWCQALDSDYGKKKKFIENFWGAFLQRTPNDHIIKLEHVDFEGVDFSLIKKHLDDEREATREERKAMTKEQREEAKRQKDAEEGTYSYALFDWLREKVATFKTEPPSLFRGRGDHPKMGRLKRRIFPEEVSLNCHVDAPVPALPPELAGHAWKDIFNDDQVSWLAYYRDTVNGQFKYTFLGASSAVKGQKDHAKYEKARLLRNHIEHIRRDYNGKLRDSDPVSRQLGTATYMLDVLALRVGNEKDSTEEADTVGCCSLRVEHVTFDEKAHSITLDFLGKDSIRYLNTVVVDVQVFKNLVNFCKNKKPDENIFDRIHPGILNKYLKDLMPGLSAKVFRTYNASVTLQQELEKLDPDLVDVRNPEAIKQFYDSANRAVAILCNHQRSVPKQHESSMDKMKVQLRKLELDIEELQQYTTWCAGTQKKPFKFVPSGDDEGVTRVSAVKDGMKEAVAVRKMEQVKKRKETHELRMRMKDENKTVSNSTSKQHYMDPR